LCARVNRAGSALRDRLGVRPEERVLLLLLDELAFAYTFFGAIKIGAVPVPLNTLWKSQDYEYVVRDSGARVLVVSSELLPQVERIPPDVRARLTQVVVTGEAFDELLASGSPDLEAAPTH